MSQADLRRRPRRHRLEEGRRRPIAASAARPGSRSNAAAAGIRHRRLDALRQAPRLPLAAGRRPRGRQARSTRAASAPASTTQTSRTSARASRSSRAKTSPFKEVPREVRRSKWVEPKLVAEIAFAEFTSDGILRHPSFLGLREDKAAREVKLERPAPVEKVMAGRRQGHRERAGIRITSPDKVLYPDQGVTKRDLLDYYEAVAELMLPHVGQPAAQPGALPAGLRPPLLLPEARHRRLSRAAAARDDPGIGSATRSSISTSTTCRASSPACR